MPVNPRILQMLSPAPKPVYPIPPLSRGVMGGGNFDNMVAPPYNLPPDRNTIDPQDIMNRSAPVGLPPGLSQEDILNYLRMIGGGEQS